MYYLERNVEKRLDPKNVFPSVKSILSLAVPYTCSHPLPYSDSDKGIVSRYASGLDYHLTVKKKLDTLLAFISEMEPSAQGMTYVDTGPVLEKHWAAYAGIGWMGKHSNVISRETGSWFFLGEILLNLELVHDAPVPNFCGSCTRCIDTCPTEAIVEPYVVDSRRCISYLTIEHRGDLPAQLRPKLRNLVFGCDICQDVCPWNSRAARLRSPVSESCNRLGHEFDLKKLARLSPEEFSTLFSKTAVKRTKWRGLMRNVAVAMGNSGNPDFLPELEILLGVEEAVVRRHAAWALGQIATEKAFQLLSERKMIEQDPATLDVLTELLNRN